MGYLVPLAVIISLSTSLDARRSYKERKKYKYNQSKHYVTDFPCENDRECEINGAYGSCLPLKGHPSQKTCSCQKLWEEYQQNNDPIAVCTNFGTRSSYAEVKYKECFEQRVHKIHCYEYPCESCEDQPDLMQARVAKVNETNNQSGVSDNSVLMIQDHQVLEDDRAIYANDGDWPILFCRYKSPSRLNNVVRWYKFNEEWNDWEKIIVMRREKQNNYFGPHYDHQNWDRQTGELTILGNIREGVKAAQLSKVDLGIGDIRFYGVKPGIHDGRYKCEVESQTEERVKYTDLLINGTNYMEPDNTGDKCDSNCREYLPDSCPMTVCYHNGTVNKVNCECNCPKNLRFEDEKIRYKARGNRCQFLVPMKKRNYCYCPTGYGLGCSFAFLNYFFKFLLISLSNNKVRKT